MCPSQADAEKAKPWLLWSSDPWQMVGEAQLARGDRSAAEQSFRTAITKDPNDPDLWQGLAYATTGRERRQALTQALRLNPRNPDLIVLATGYYPQVELVRRALGEAMVERIGPVWGIDADGELSNMFKRTAQEGLWFIAGGLAQCRIYSKYMALQIKAMELGRLGPLPTGRSVK